jgi:hypothetical protein
MPAMVSTCERLARSTTKIALSTPDVTYSFPVSGARATTNKLIALGIGIV